MNATSHTAPPTITEISDFDGDGVVYRFRASIGLGDPRLLVEADYGSGRVVWEMSPRDIGEFGAHFEAARKALLKLHVVAQAATR